MTILVLLLSALLYGRLICAAQRNSTVDDGSPLVEYHATLWARSTAGFDGSQLFDGTVTFVHPSPNETPTISFNFTGTAVYIFVAYPSGKTATVPIGFAAWLDDSPAGEWRADQLAPLSNHLAFSTTALSNGPHRLVLALCLQCSLYFDYAVITSDPDPIGTSSSAAGTTTPTLPAPTSFGNNNAVVPTVTVSASVPTATKPSLTPSVSVSTVNVPVPASTSPGGVAVATSTGNTPVPTDSDNIPVQTSTSHKQMPVAAIVGGVLGAVMLLALVSTPLVLRRRALARKAKARNTFSPFMMWKTDGDGHTDEEGDGNTRGPPLTPLVLHPPPPARFANLRGKSPLSVTIPTRTAIPEAPTRTPGTEAPQTPLSAASDVALMQIAEQMRRMRMSMQRLETGMPEARDGGSALMRPPAYGSGNRQSQAYNANEPGHGNRE